MNASYEEMRYDVARLKQELEGAERRLAIAVRSCNHRWSETTPDHIRYESYLIPGDPPGVGGSDHRSDLWVDAKTEKRWKRVCQVCGEIEYTSRTRAVMSEEPEF